MLCAVIVITGLCDLVKAVADLIDDSNDVPNYQIISPIVLLLSAVSVCVCVQRNNSLKISQATRNLVNLRISTDLENLKS